MQFIAFVVAFILVGTGVLRLGTLVGAILGVFLVIGVFYISFFLGLFGIVYIFMKSPEQKLHDCLYGYEDRGSNVPPAPRPEECYYNYHLVVPQTSTIGPPLVQDCSNEYANKHGGHCSSPFIPGHHPAENDASPVIVGNAPHVIVGKCYGSCPSLPPPQQQRPVPPSPNAPAAPIQGFQPSFK